MPEEALDFDQWSGVSLKLLTVELALMDAKHKRRSEGATGHFQRSRHSKEARSESASPALAAKEVSSIGERNRSRLSLTAGVIGIGVYLMAGGLYLGSGLVVPYPWAYWLWAVWIGGIAVLVSVFRRSPIWTPIVPIAAVALWVTVVQIGHWLLGWTA